MTRAVRVRFFATARVAAGRAALEWPVPDQGIPAREIVRSIAEAYPSLGRTLRACRFLRNGHYLDDLSERVRPGDEFAVHPPYGGG